MLGKEKIQRIAISNYEYNKGRFQLSANLPLTPAQAYHILIDPQYQALGQDVMARHYGEDYGFFTCLDSEDARACETLEEFAEWGPFELWISIAEDNAEDIRKK